MIKKMGLLAVIVVGGLMVLNTSYASLGWKKLKGAFKNQITPEMKVELIKEEVSKLGKDMKQQISAVAEESVAVDNLREQITVAEANHKKQLDVIRTMRTDLSSEKTVLVYGGKEFPVERVRGKLARDWDSYKAAEKAIESKKKLLEAREKSLAAAQDRLGAMRSKREQLELQVAQLEADLKNVRLAQTKSDFNFDETRIGEIQGSIHEVQDWIKTQQKVTEYEGKYNSDPIPVGEKANPADVTKEIDAYMDKEIKVTPRITAEK